METCWRCLAEVPAQKALSHKQRCRGCVHGVVGLWNQTAALGRKHKACQRQSSLASLTARGSRRRTRCVGCRSPEATASVAEDRFAQAALRREDLARREHARPRREPAPLASSRCIVLYERNAPARVPTVPSEQRKPEHLEVGEEEDQLCAICFEQHDDTGDRIWLPCCHSFHEACVLPWLRESMTCPTCRHDFGSASESEAESETLSEVSFFG
eukprot:TRINITY_DN77322_c0_g1_i1.p1 TRINITY_DN77322_c0_g1~~TRINITY_DN77322_c0_g1_i1.p1  ORF type:complete len:214 (+),score=33.82 TRINITY_DN77322_c0_g1_i1:58-699(+)